MAQQARRKAPTWKPSVAEALVEAALELPVEERYGANISKAAGFRGDDTTHVFHALLRHRVLEYTEPGLRPKVVVFSAESLAQILGDVSTRIDQLSKTRDAILRLSASVESIEAATEPQAAPQAVQLTIYEAYGS